MNFRLGNKLRIEEPPQSFVDFINKELVFDNPDFLKKQALGKWTGNTQRKIVLYEHCGCGTYNLPFGTCARVYRLFKDYIDELEPLFAPLRARNYKSSIRLYDYQENAVQRVLAAKNGILVAPCGSGKTQMGLELAARIGGKALWITHTQDLLKQSMERARACFGMPASEYGTITGGKINIGNTITFATVQTLAKIDLLQYTKDFDVVIVDECHKCVGTPTQMTMFYKVLSRLTARYKIGLTATPFRADGMDKCMFAILGDIAAEVPKEAVADKTCPVNVEFHETTYTPDFDKVLAGDGTLIYSQFIDDICDNYSRNEDIADQIACWCDGATLVLSERVAHLVTLQSMVKKENPDLRTMRLSASNTKLEKQYRAVALDKMRNRECDILFATYKLAKEGLDIPNLQYVVFASPVKDKTTVIQSAGRVARKCEGKERGTIIDFVDDFGMLRGYAKKRLAIYKKQGYIVDKT